MLATPWGAAGASILPLPICHASLKVAEGFVKEPEASDRPITLRIVVKTWRSCI